MAQHQTTSDDYYTPRWLFDRLGLEFDMDVAAPEGGAPWVPAKRYLTLEDDGLATPWEGRVWMNPPFSGIMSAWVDKFIAHGHGVCLVPHSRGRWHTRLWISADALVDPNSPNDSSMFQFVRDGKPTTIYMPVFLAAFGDDCVEAIGRLGRVRR